VAASCASEATRDDSGVIVEEGDLNVFSFQLGDCFSNDAIIGSAAGDGTEVGSVAAVPCDESHDAEVFYLFDVDGGDFPGDDAIQEQVGKGCLGKFDSFVGRAYEESDLEVGALWPTELTWSDGDREIVCYVRSLDGEALEGSMEGSER